ncbi:MAG: S8 family serine peptidase, partial [Nitrospinae bacterium]|nr:S8 family serine peptidase [Nitrospinota bacterium]
NILGLSSTGGATRMTGTSMAAPFVTGTLALLWSLYPETSAQLMRDAVLRLQKRNNQLFPPLLNGEQALWNLKLLLKKSKPIRNRQKMNYVQTKTVTPQRIRAGIFPQEDVTTLPQGSSGATTIPNTTPEVNEEPIGIEETTSYSTIGYIYAVGSLSAVFPNDGLMQEFNRIVSVTNTSGSGNKLLFTILSNDKYRYIAEEMQWVMEINNVKTYSVTPRGSAILDEMIESLKKEMGVTSYQVVIGPRSPMGAINTSGSEQLPTVICEQLYNFTLNEFVNNIVTETKVDQDVVAGLFQQMLQKTDNSGATDEDRAINYIALRYLNIYQMADGLANKENNNKPLSLDSIAGEPARAMGMRKIVDVVFEYKECGSDNIIWKIVKVDTTGLFPFLVKEVETNQPRP